MLLPEYLSNNAKKHKEEEAIVYANFDENTDGKYYRESITWKKFNQYANMIANMLIDKNIKKGDKVAILLSNNLFWLPIYFGILKAGAIAVPLNYRNNLSETTYCIEFAECKLLFISDDNQFVDQIPVLLGTYLFSFRVKKDITSFELSLEAYSSTFENISLKGNDKAAIYFSSGTTGKSKAVLLNHSSLVSAAQIELSHHRQTKEDKFLCLTPLYHTGSKIHWLGSFLAGGAIVIFNSSSPIKIAQVIMNEKISIAFLLVHHIQDFLDAISSNDINLKENNISCLRLMHSGAQPVPPALIQRWCEIFPNMQYDTNYGLTEATGPGCIHLGFENINKVGAIGKPDELWKAKIVNVDGNPVSQGTVGELALKGPGVMVEYYKNSEATKQTLKSGWLYTGDIAKEDNDGYIYIVGRKKDVIITGGENIYPIQIENHIRKMPMIKDVAVIGVPNRRMGEIAVAIVELKTNYFCTKNKIKDFCKKLPPHQRPTKIIFDTVIRNETGKIDKSTLLSRYLSWKLTYK